MNASAATTTTPAGARAPSTPAPAPAGRRVIDAPVRMFHWLFAATFAAAYVTAESEHWRVLHATLGYTFGALLVLRVLYGLAGPRQARLRLWGRRLAGWPAWLRSLPQANWRQGQSLLTALAVVATMALVPLLVASGHGSFSDWGEWLEEVHEFAGHAVLSAVLLHVGLIAVASVLRRQNQALPMLTGRQQGPGPGLVQHDRAWLAVVLLVASAGFAGWLWQVLAPAAAL